ncbi:MAG: Tn3 family transposase [Cyanobacteria bacterium J06592_8]
MEGVIDQLRSEGYLLSDEDINRLSPTRYEHINPYGTYQFNKELCRCLAISKKN